ncbi:DNA cytosine methyltransferase [Micromonospora aurantiaca (nom. illeg.)]|uniref:DNA cytosine methyltransferase n=1 Tax=Micromonospora aurantiaca (nom. illeg.) TaxID=47850 RepID=UPI0035B1A2D8
MAARGETPTLDAAGCVIDHRPAPRIGSLCTGYGGLDMAVELVLGGELTWYAETDRHARTVCAHHWPGVPNLGDIRTVDWTRVEPIDVLTAGFPCQDISNAGKRAGITGEHSSLWSAVADAVRVLRPPLVFVENVAALLRRGFDVVEADLAAIGYDTSWTCLRASDIGAAHRRDRLFLLYLDTLAQS